MRLRTALFSAALLAGALFLAACPSQTSINKIKGDPSRYENKTVGIIGTVRDSYGALNYGAYEVDDGTGTIWVISDQRGVPGRGARVGVQGQVYNGFAFAGRNFGTVIKESQRRVKDR
jgi:hypothetical protein